MESLFFVPNFIVRPIRSIRSPYTFPHLKKRKRKTKNRPNPLRRNKFRCNNLGLSYEESNYTPLILNSKTSTILSYKVKTGTRWFPSKYKYSSVLPLRYIDPHGNLTNRIFAYWDTDFRALLASMISTVYDRITRYFRRLRSERFCYQHNKELVAVATIYVFADNLHLLKRSIYLLKNKKFHDLRFFLSDRLKRLDNNTRFVCCQALKQADWLSSRATKVSRKSRDKNFKFPIFDFRKFESGDEKFTDMADLSLCFLYRNYINRFQLIINLGPPLDDLD